MFATLGGSLPVLLPAADAGATSEIPSAAFDGPGDGGSSADLRVRAAIEAQEAAGLELFTDGGQRHPNLALVLATGLRGIDASREGVPVVRSPPTWQEPILVSGWELTAVCTDRAVRQSVVGPYSLARALDSGLLRRERLTLALAEALNAELLALAGAGCPVIEVVEDDSVVIGDDPAERRLYAGAQKRLLAGLDDVHVCLAIRGGNAATAGAAMILDAPYRSFLFDLCSGPDNWRLVVEVPSDRGVIVGAADVRTTDPDKLELLAFAIGYAASTAGRGHDRVGLATSGDMAGLPVDVALAKMARIGEAARLYAAEPGSLARAIDPRAADIRSAALGRYAPAAYDPASPPSAVSDPASPPSASSDPSSPASTGRGRSADPAAENQPDPD